MGYLKLGVNKGQYIGYFNKIVEIISILIEIGKRAQIEN